MKEQLQIYKKRNLLNRRILVRFICMNYNKIKLLHKVVLVFVIFTASKNVT